MPIALSLFRVLNSHCVDFPEGLNELIPVGELGGKPIRFQTEPSYNVKIEKTE